LKRSVFRLSLFLAVLAPFFCRAAEPVVLFAEDDGGPGKVHRLSARDKGLHPHDAFLYNENYFLIAITGSGYYGYVNMLVSNSGITSGQPGISFTIVTPEGERLVRDRDFDPEDLEASDDPMSFSAGGNRLREIEGGYELKVGWDDMGMELVYKNEAPGFVLGNGKAVFGGDGGHFFYINYPGPRSEVWGRFIVRGQELPVSGWGYVDHSLSVTNPAAFEDTWHNMKFYSDTHSVIISSFTTPGDYEKDFGIAAITDGSSILCASTVVRVIEKDIEHDPDSGKSYPNTIIYQVEGPGCSARAVVDSSLVTEKFDVLQKLEQKWYGKAVKAVINTFIAEPWFYRAVTPVTVELEIEGRKITVDGQAFNEVIYTR